ncbi:macro domain-containing protein [Niveibacterium sp. 24ML]|uniref:macro domain-containing protein n=1 Tax=Niveibacterium sp. 24ML TaxID=2985512 RepID=UPI003B640E76
MLRSASSRLARLKVWRGNITTLALYGAIHRAAGPQLRAFFATQGGCPVGEARITPGFGLPARHILPSACSTMRSAPTEERCLTPC